MNQGYGGYVNRGTGGIRAGVRGVLEPGYGGYKSRGTGGIRAMVRDY